MASESRHNIRFQSHAHPSKFLASVWHLLDKKFYFAVRLTFGCKSSPKIFDMLSEALCWILQNNHAIPYLIHLLDDFPRHFPKSFSCSQTPNCRPISVFKTRSSPSLPRKPRALLLPWNFSASSSTPVKFQALSPQRKNRSYNHSRI